MPKIRFYHVRALLWTYVVWAFLSLWFAYGCCNANQVPFVKAPLTRILYYWAFLHILPLWGSIMTLWEGDMGGFMICVTGVVGGLLVVAGLLKNGSWARFGLVAGMSLWFLVGFFALGLSV